MSHRIASDIEILGELERFKVMVANTIYNELYRQKISVKDLADRAGMKAWLLQKLLDGDEEFTALRIARLALALGVQWNLVVVR